MHAPLAKFSMMRRLMSSAWWLGNSAIDIDFRNNRAHDGIPVDPLRSSTVLMLHGDGADASTNVSDSTGRNFGTPAGAQISTAQSKFGGASISFPSSGDLNFLGSDFAFGTGDFTIDFWVRRSEVTNQVNLVSNGTYIIYFASADATVRFWNGSATTITGTTSFAINTWYHVALTRSAGDFRLFLNGVQEGSTYSASLNFTAAQIGIGYNGAQFAGWIDEFRVVKTVAAWTSNFTVPTMPYNVGVGPYDLLSCSRASVGYAQTAAGTLTQFPANQLRITDRGLLVEDARTSIINRSEEMSHAFWSAAGLTSRVDNSAVSPNGLTTAATLTLDTSGASHNIFNNTVFGIGSGTYSFSAYFKAGTCNFAALGMVDDLGNRYAAVINLTTGVITDTHSQGSPVSPSAAVEALGNGWFRLSITVGGGNDYIQFGLSNSATPTWGGSSCMPEYTGNGTDTILVWGAQVEAGAFATSYISTTTAAATRAADAVECLAALKSTFESTAGTALINLVWSPASAMPTGISSRIIYTNGGATLYVPSTPSTMQSYDGGAALNFNFADSLQFNTGVKAGYAWSSTGRSLVGQGGTTVSDASTNPRPLLAAFKGTGNNEAFYYRRVTGWTERLADADLSAVTGATVRTDYAVDLNFQTGVYTVNARPQFYLTCSRASVGYAQTVAGTLTQFIANQLRITDLGLLVEDARTNNALRSQEFDAGSWSDARVGVTVTANAAVAPDGTTTADKLEATSGDSFVRQNAIARTASTTYTFSVYLKADTPTTLNIYELDGTTSTVCNVTTTWQRFTLTWTAPGSGSTVDVQIGGGSSFTTGEVVYAWGAQTEAAAFASSYIPTTTAAATRAADDVTCIGSLGTTLTQLPESVVADLKFFGDPTTNFVRLVYFSGGSNEALLHINNSNTSVGVFNTTGGILAATLGNSLTFTGGVKVGSSQNVSGRSVVGGGGTVNSDASNFLSTTAKLTQSTTTNFSYYRRLTAWTSRLADATLQGFTNP